MKFSEVRQFLVDIKSTKIMEIISRNNLAKNWEDMMATSVYKVPGRDLIKKVFCHFYRNMKPSLEKEMAVLRNTELRWDHTFKTGKNKQIRSNEGCLKGNQI